MGLRKLFIPEARAIPFHEEVPAGVCPNCENTLTGSHCSACGQKDRARKDFTLGTFFGEAFHQFTHFDSKFFRSFKLLLFKPGALTVAYLRGKRSTYMKPVQLFIVINILYFIYLHFVPITTFASNLHVQTNLLPYSNAVRPLVDKKVRQLDVSYKEYEKAFNKSMAGYAKTLIFLMIPLFGFLLAILYILRKYYFVEHLVFATHFFSFFLILVSIGVTLVILLFELFASLSKLPLNESDLSEWITVVPGLAAGVYLYIALRKVYQETHLVTFLKTSTILVLLIPMMNIFRLILFFATFYTVKIH